MFKCRLEAFRPNFLHEYSVSYGLFIFQSFLICGQDSAQQTLWPNFCLLSFGLSSRLLCSAKVYSVGLCSDCLGLGAVWQLTTALDLNVKTTPAPEPSNCEPFTVEDRHLSPHPCIACPTHLNVLINSPTIKAQAHTGYGIHCSLISKKLGLSSSMTSLPTFSSAWFILEIKKERN